MDGAPALRQARLSEVDRVVAGAGRHPPAGLRARLRSAHARCEAVDARAWSAYVTDLDRGVDELHAELGRVTERAVPGPTLDDVLLARTAALELDAWRLAAAGSPGLRPAVADAGEALARYREGLAGAGPPPRAELAAALARLRAAGDPAPGAAVPPAAR